MPLLTSGDNMIIGLDPGTTHTGYCLIDFSYKVKEAGKAENARVRDMLKQMPVSHAAIESLACYGMAVGREVFETAYQIGRFQEILESRCVPVALYAKPEYGPAIAGVRKVTDSVIRQSLLLRFGGDKKGEPLHLLRGDSDRRSAFAVAAYHLDNLVRAKWACSK